MSIHIKLENFSNYGSLDDFKGTDKRIGKKTANLRTVPEVIEKVIFSYLTPYDVSRAARTSKQFYKHSCDMYTKLNNLTKLSKLPIVKAILPKRSSMLEFYNKLRASPSFVPALYSFYEEQKNPNSLWRQGSQKQLLDSKQRVDEELFTKLGQLGQELSNISPTTFQLRIDKQLDFFCKVLGAFALLGGGAAGMYELVEWGQKAPGAVFGVVIGVVVVMCAMQLCCGARSINLQRLNEERQLDKMNQIIEVIGDDWIYNIDEIRQIANPIHEDVV